MKRGPACLSERGLSRLQLDAIKLIASGCTARYAALVLKIKFSELNKWMTRDEQFTYALAEQTKNLQSNESPETAKPIPAKKGARVANPTKRSPN